MSSIKWTKENTWEVMDFINFDMTWAFDGRRLPVGNLEKREWIEVGDIIIKNLDGSFKITKGDDTNDNKY